LDTEVSTLGQDHQDQECLVDGGQSQPIEDCPVDSATRSVNVWDVDHLEYLVEKDPPGNDRPGNELDLLQVGLAGIVGDQIADVRPFGRSGDVEALRALTAARPACGDCLGK